MHGKSDFFIQNMLSKSSDGGAVNAGTIDRIGADTESGIGKIKR